MIKPQFILLSAGILLVAALYFFAPTTPKNKMVTPTASTSNDNLNNQAPDINIEQLIDTIKKELTPQQKQYLFALENTVKRGDVKDQQIHVYHQLAAYWRDSIKNGFVYMEYNRRAALLENSEKNLTFAAHLFFDEAKRMEEPSIKAWLANRAKELFERAVELNPDNDSSQIALGACVFFGAKGMPMEAVKRITEVVNKHPENMFGQFMLGYGAMLSQQWDKVIQRMLLVTQNQPDNLEALLLLANAYERKSDKENAVKWYWAAKNWLIKASKTNNPKVFEQTISMIDERINALK